MSKTTADNPSVQGNRWKTVFSLYTYIPPKVNTGALLIETNTKKAKKKKNSNARLGLITTANPIG